METMGSWLATALLGAAIWVAVFLLPKARREQDTFGTVCSILALLAAVFGWLFLGGGVRSR